jgi:hypothetical protein
LPVNHGHVLDDALELDANLLEHERGALRDLLCRRLGRGDDVCLGAGQNCEIDKEMSPCRGQIDEKEVGFVPEDVGQELFECLVQHRAAPDDG